MAVVMFRLMAGFGYRLAGMESLTRATYADLEKAASAARRVYQQDPHDTHFLLDQAFAQVYSDVAKLDSRLFRTLQFLHDPSLAPEMS
ncbi:hypothetical protein IAT38_002526 [Cryptococcus sp. DSM 104549]